MNRRLILVANGILLVIALAAALTFYFSKPPSFRGTLYGEPFPPAADFELTQAGGETFRMSDQRGKIVLLFFGYTSCPDVCPTTMAEMAQMTRELGGDARFVQVVFVSVDPKRDTPEKVQEYASRFNPDFIGLSGSQADLEPVWQSYSIFREEVQGNTAAGYTVDHTARLYLIDFNGDLRLSYAYGTPVADVAHDIRILLEQSK